MVNIGVKTSLHTIVMSCFTFVNTVDVNVRITNYRLTTILTPCDVAPQTRYH